MGTYSRLCLPIFLLIATVVGVRYTLLIDSETASASERYTREAAELGDYLRGALRPALAKQDRAALESVLASALLLNADVSAARLAYAGGHLEAVRAMHPVAAYPAWFVRLRGLGAMIGRHEQLRGDLDDTAGGQVVLRLRFDPTLQLNQIWHTVRQQAIVSAINILLVFSLLALIVLANQRMLRRHALATERFQSGDHGVRLPVGGTLEARALAATFNNMAATVQELVQSLQQSQRQLAEQLAHTERTKAQLRAEKDRMELISWQSNHDLLTGLPNRAALALRFEHEMARARRDATLLAVCLFDLDHFQQVNQLLGQAIGDDVLKQAAGRLHDFAGQRHYVARLGGDEFVLLLPDLDRHDGIEEAVQRLLAALARDYLCAGQLVTLSASVGVAIFSDGDVSADKLLRRADQALYQAKLMGRNRAHFFDAVLDQQVRTHHNRRTEVRAALHAGEMRLHYQPKLDMRHGRIIGMEALLRWQHPQRGMVGPMDFLPIVEHSDIIVDIGEWVMRAALRQLQAWRNVDPGWVISVNIAARHFQRPDFVARLTAILAEFPEVPPRMLELEILESSALDDVGHVRAMMQACQALGIGFALDDFGTGYSSMSYLKRLPADILKIDQSFVRNMLDDRDDLYLVGAVIGLARSFGLRVIAEGVETVAHGAMLMRLGCDLAQGYGIARPMPADAVLPWLTAFDSAPLWQAAASLPPLQDLRDMHEGAQPRALLP